MESLTNYYGTDWVAAFSSVLMIYLVGNKNPAGFVFGLLANISWISFALLTGSIPIISANIVFLVLNVRGYLNWKKSQ